MVRNMTKAAIDEFIREDPVCCCDFCGRQIYAGQDMLVAITADGKEAIHTCEFCAEGRVGGPGIEEYLDVLGVWNWSGPSEDADKIALERLRRIKNGRITV